MNLRSIELDVTDLAKASFENLTATAMKFQQLSMKLATASMEPINKRFAETVSNYGKPFATV